MKNFKSLIISLCVSVTLCFSVGFFSLGETSRVYADENEAKALNVDKLTALVKKEGITYDEKGEVLEYLQSVINKEWVAFEKDDPVIKQKMEEVLHGL